MWLRYVFVPDVRRCRTHFQLCEIRASLGNVERVTSCLSQMGRFKWKELKLNYTLDDVQPPARETVETACALFRAEGLNAY